MFEQYFLSIVISSIVTYLVWIRSKKWLRKKIKSQIQSNSDKKLYWIFFFLTLIAHFALLVSLVFFIDLFNFVFK
ncbi:MAG: hypothetical protein CMC59_00500 [Flavobacteriaceae bacterium]|nr:hypothetical protein [Flavobacteriaceae bacterium]